jgi:hypothetical protein
MPRLIDITGQRFGRLVVTEKATSGRKNTRWKCACDCGNTTTVFKSALTCSKQKSCGCYMREISKVTQRKNSVTHDMRHSPEYSVFSGMKRRCENPNERCYPRYGGAGILCKFRSFEEFFDEVGRRPSPHHSIDRIDNTGHYERGNVRWATLHEQSRNKKTTLKIEAFGQTKCLADWCDEFGLRYQAVWSRIVKSNWPPEIAFTKNAHRIRRGDHAMKTTGGLFRE